MVIPGSCVFLYLALIHDTLFVWVFLNFFFFTMSFLELYLWKFFEAWFEAVLLQRECSFVHSQIPPSLISWQLLSCFLTINSPTVDVSCKWSHTLRGLLRLASLTEHAVHPCGSIFQHFVPSNGWVYAYTTFCLFIHQLIKLRLFSFSGCFGYWQNTCEYQPMRNGVYRLPNSSEALGLVCGMLVKTPATLYPHALIA